MRSLLCILLFVIATTQARAQPAGQRFVSIAFHDVVDQPTDLSADAVNDLGQNDAGAAQASALLFAATMRRIDVPEATAHRLAALLRPGTTLVITDKPVDSNTYSAPGFTIMTTGDT